MTDDALLIFVKNLIEGRVKTRLADTLGNDTEMDIYKRLLKNTHDRILPVEKNKIAFYSDFIENDILKNNLFQKETDSNFSIIFLGGQVAQHHKTECTPDVIVTGVPVHRDEKELTTGNLLKLPFTKIREWTENENPNTDDRNRGKLKE